MNKNETTGNHELSPSASAEKLHKPLWQTPKIEEVDYTETQSGPIHPGGVDFGLYS